MFFNLFKGKSWSESKKLTKQIINQVGLKSDFTKKVRQLSGGMKRRCSLAIALTGDPDILFLDEPSSGLDPVKRRQFWALIKQLKGDKALMLTTHLMEEAETLCNNIGIITKGQLRCHGTSTELKSYFTKGL